MTEFVGAIDQGTTSTRFMVFDRRGRVVASGQREHRQIFPRPGWVEHDPDEIWQKTCEAIDAALSSGGLRASDLAAVGITNQRETAVVWDRATGKPAANAVVWQDTRTAELVAQLSREGGQDRFRRQTGLPLATYFSAPKVSWLLDHHGLRRRAEGGELAFGTIDSWLAYHLIGEHLTDVTNASRTMLFDLHDLDWSPALADSLGVPPPMLPRVVSSSQVYGECRGPLAGVPLAGILGDQQAALFGQACYQPGDAKNTYGTGCFLLLNTGTTPVDSTSGLLTTVGYRLGDQPAVYALEGSVAIAGALVHWLRDSLGIIASSPEIEDLARSVHDNGDVYFVPAFSGLFAPHWRSDARGVIVGLTRFATKGHLARAALEATAFQTQEVLAAMRIDSGVNLRELKVDGGMVGNELLMQFQADLLDVPVVRPRVAETTALGAAYVAGLAVGYFSGLAELAGNWGEDRRFVPSMPAEQRSRLLARWRQAVERTLDWVPS